ncbi:MAG: sulfur carrier protein ThiS [Eubacteriales bacterium]|nr:sulfur carrier protein ThiS [Eubacteriales bacterium]
MVTINGSPVQVSGMNILDYLRQAGFSPEVVVVEKNLQIIPREALGSTLLEDGDNVEILRFVGGG